MAGKHQGTFPKVQGKDLRYIHVTHDYSVVLLVPHILFATVFTVSDYQTPIGVGSECRDSWSESGSPQHRHSEAFGTGRLAD